MIKANTIKALVFAYEDDEFNRSQELKFLTEKYPNSVKLVSYKCGNGHYTLHNDCKLSKTKKQIGEHMKKQKILLKD